MTPFVGNPAAGAAASKNTDTIRHYHTTNPVGPHAAHAGAGHADNAAPALLGGFVLIPQHRAARPPPATLRGRRRPARHGR